MWQEFDQYHSITMESSKNVVILKRFVEINRSYQFMAGLGEELGRPHPIY